MIEPLAIFVARESVVKAGVCRRTGVPPAALVRASKPLWGPSLGSNSVLICGGYHAKYHKLGSSISEMYFLTVLETRTPISRCQQREFL